MSDPNLAEFYKRAARLETQRAKGKGFEAPGALGRSHYHLPPRKRQSILRPALFLLTTGFLLKGAIFYATGAEVYNSRVAELRSASGLVEQAGGWMMQSDPITQWLADMIAMGVRKVRP